MRLPCRVMDDSALPGGDGSSEDSGISEPEPGPRPEPDAPRISRRLLLASAAVAVGAAGAAAIGFELDVPAAFKEPTSGPPSPRGAQATATPAPASTASKPPPGPRFAFRSRPDIRPPQLVVRTPAAGTAPGLLLLTPNNGDGPDGPTIYDEAGGLVWMRPGTGPHATNLQVIRYQGAPAICWWEGSVTDGIGDGEFVIMDATYRELHRVRTAGGGADLHEFVVTADGTALYFVDRAVSPPSGQVMPTPAPSPTPTATPSPAPSRSPATSQPPASPEPPTVLDCAVVEIDLATGRRLFEWHSVDHIAIDETYAGAPRPTGAYDYVHANSIEVDDDGTLLVSARNTCAVYKIDRSSGEIVWRLGGRRSDFRMLAGATFGWQHDVRRRPDGTITLFDDQQPPEPGRGLTLRLDETAMTATHVGSYRRSSPLQVSSQGNMQVLPNGNILVGWGAQPVLTEFGPDGTVLLDATLPAGKQSYRIVRADWSGRPADQPALAIDPLVDATSSQRRVIAYASWNGATEVRAWALLAGATARRLAEVAVVPRTGFETVITEVLDPKRASFVAVAALDEAGNRLGSSETLATS